MITVPEKIELELLDIINMLDRKLPKEDIERAKEYTLAREWGIAFEHLCDQIYEYDVKIPDKIFVRLESLGMSMKIEDSYWQDLRDLVEK